MINLLKTFIFNQNTKYGKNFFFLKFQMNDMDF